MAFSKKELFNLLPQLVAEISKGLGHPARIRIILYLLEHDDASFQELQEMMPLHRATISQHLRLLRRHKLVDVHERFPHTYYGLNKEEVRKAMLILNKFMHQLAEHGIHPKDLKIVLEDLEEE